MQHKIDRAVHSDPVYKFVWSLVIGEQSDLEKSLPVNPSNEFAVCGNDKGFSDSWQHSVGNLFTDHIVFYYMKGLCNTGGGSY